MKGNVSWQKGKWNVIKMAPGFSNDLERIDDERETDVISGELSRL